MKLSSFQKNLYIFFSVVISILVATLLWEKINLPLNNITGAKGILVSEGYNPTNDTLRYIFFIAFPLIIFLFLNQILKKKTIRIRELIFEKDEKIVNSHPTLIILSFIFIIFILFEFFSFNFPIHKLDLLHDGDYLTPAQNYLSTKKFWISSFTIHGGSDFFYPLIMWKILDVQSIGGFKVSLYFLILFIKLFSVLLAYQLTKISNITKEAKILLFTILAAILISMSDYRGVVFGYYFATRDIFVILFLIFFIELFIHSKFRSLSTILICLIATISILFHFDRGVYINFILIFYCLYLFVIKKYNDVLLIFFSLVICWTIAINLIGFNEFVAYLDNFKTIIFSADLIHGLKYPNPFFSTGDHPDGTRATKGLLLQITAGLFVLDYLISNKNKIFSSKKVLFVFLFLLSFIMYKNALGRSDAGHIRMSNGFPILINSFFILNYLLIFLEKTKALTRKNSYNIFFFTSLIFLLFFYIINQSHYKIDNIKNFNKNFINYINFDDKNFLDQETAKLVNYYKSISEKDTCVQNFTFAFAFPYLIKKPSCTKYYASWLASPIAKQKDYIKKIKKIQPKYILHESPKTVFYFYHKLDGLAVYDRLELVNSYILSNYKKYDELGAYIVLEKK